MKKVVPSVMHVGTVNVKMSIYTRKGDKGETGLFSNDKSKKIRVSKSSSIIEAIGSVDELNSFLGVISSEIKLKSDLYYCYVTIVQANLFTINSILAGSKLKFGENETKKLEHQIDIWEKEMPPQKNFIFYGGSKVSSLIFYARALCRRAERSIVKLNEESKISSTILIYINRVSDYLFAMARYMNFKEKIKEKAWSRK